MCVFEPPLVVGGAELEFGEGQEVAISRADELPPFDFNEVSGEAPFVASNLVGRGRVCAAGDRSKAAPAYQCDEVLARIASALALLVAFQSLWPWPLPLTPGCRVG